MISRSRILSGATAAIVAGASRKVGAADLVPLRVGMSPIDPSAEAFYAQELGFFREAGFDVQLFPMSNGGALVAALAGGALDIYSASIISAAQAHIAGFEVRAFAPANTYAGPPASTVIVAGAGSSIRSGADLNGKTCAVNGLKDFSQVTLQAWVDATGGDSKSLKLIEIPFSAVGNALARGLIDAAMLVEPFSSAGVENGTLKIIGDAMAPVGKHFMVTGWYAKPGWLDANRDAAHRFSDVILQTAKWANKNHDKSAAILAKYTPLSVETIRKTVRAYYGETPLTAEQAQPSLDAATKYVGMQKVSAATLLWRG